MQKALLCQERNRLKIAKKTESPESAKRGQIWLDCIAWVSSVSSVFSLRTHVIGKRLYQAGLNHAYLWALAHIYRPFSETPLYLDLKVLGGLLNHLKKYGTALPAWLASNLLHDR